jgi:hypothetical protein
MQVSCGAFPLGTAQPPGEGGPPMSEGLADADKLGELARNDFYFRKAAEGIRQLAQTVNPRDGQLLLTQDKFREELHRDICQSLRVSGETVDLKQRVYDSQNQNEEQTYTYCRSCFPVAELVATESGMAVA